MNFLQHKLMFIHNSAKLPCDFFLLLVAPLFASGSSVVIVLYSVTAQAK